MKVYTLNHRSIVATVFVCSLIIVDVESAALIEAAGETGSHEGGIDLTAISSYHQIVKWLGHISETYPSTVQIHDLGRTAENRSILVVEIGRAAEKPETSSPADARKQLVTRPSVFLDAGTHGREQITVTIALRLISKLIGAITRNETSQFTEVKWYITPLVNPDGYEYSRNIARSWRKNRSTHPGSSCTGVDINRNWRVHWDSDEPERVPKDTAGSAGNKILSSVAWLWSSFLHPENTVRQLGTMTPCSELYGGPSPFSEFESRSLSQFILNLTRVPAERLESCFSLHSMTGNQELLFPYGYKIDRVPDYEALNSLARDMTREMAKVAGRQYKYGGVAETLYQSSGLQCDWIYSVAGVNRTFVVEVADNFRIAPAGLISKAFGELWAALDVLLKA
ncbi:putative Carboxypeptidase A5 [Hypsibius exemplaris]|uniref:Carboxypeptidase A5 n=1 Tax=Hypsibius exemplaris TaxID=2072580 RepID=A0A1W0XCR2_HYPEX|nr:putative Carboxypeptidase A5 [Hypsibius exemplaris]